MRTRDDLSLNYKGARTAKLDETLEAIEIDGIGERLGRPMERCEIRSELRILRSKLVVWERVVDNKEQDERKGMCF